MNPVRPIFVVSALTFGAGIALADMPPNVRCAIAAQEKARNTGMDYQQIYNRNFELCMLNVMPREKQTTQLIKRLEPYVAISPGPNKQKLARSEQPKFTGMWVRISPNVWVLER